MHITYHFPRRNRETVMVLYIVGIGPDEDNYMPMMWESVFVSDPKSRLFDFKYVIKRGNWS